jgi:hypothetical protein
MVNENEKEEMAYSLPSNSDINRIVLYLIHDGKIGEKLYTGLQYYSFQVYETSKPKEYQNYKP